MQGKIKSKVMLARRNNLAPWSSLIYVMCQEFEEDLNHLLLNCQFAWKVWCVVIKWWGLVWVTPESLREHAIWWWSLKFRKLEKQLWESLFISILWHIWKARNETAFYNNEVRWWEVLEEAKFYVAVWLKAGKSSLPLSVSISCIHWKR